MDQKQASTPQIFSSDSILSDSLHDLAASLPTLQEICGDGFDLSSFDPDNPLSWPLEFFETCEPSREDTVMARVVSNNGNGTVILEPVMAYRWNGRIYTQRTGKYDFLLDPRFLSPTDLNSLILGTLVWVWVEDLSPDSLGFFNTRNQWISYWTVADKKRHTTQLVRLAWAMVDASLRRLEEAHATGEILKARVVGWKLNNDNETNYPDGGVIVATGATTGFLHRSRIDYARGLRPDLSYHEVEKILKTMVNKEIFVKVGLIDIESRRLYLNEREAMDQIRKQRAEVLWPILKVGQIFEAVVNNIDGPLTFVRIEGCLDGIIHQSELQHGWVFDPTDVVSPGDAFPVQVISVNPDRRRVAFSRKALLSNPWENLDRISALEGQILTGIMTNQTQTGAIWVQVELGISGPLYPNDEPGLKFVKGQEILVKVLDIDFAQRHLVLSHHQAILEAIEDDLTTSSNGVIDLFDDLATAEVPDLFDDLAAPEAEIDLFSDLVDNGYPDLFDDLAVS